jgi:hypothetical protein
MGPGIEVQKAAVVDADSALEEYRNLKRQFVHLLERQSWDGYVGRVPASMFAIGNATDLLVMRRAAVTVVDDDRLSGERPQLLKALNKRGVDLQLTAAMAG